MRLLVSGSRGWCDDATTTLIHSKLNEFHEKDCITTLISGHAKGGDTIAEQWANKMGIPIEIHKPDWKQYGRSAGMMCNIKMINAADYVVAFWDGTSKGTKHAMDYAASKDKLKKTFKP